MREPPLATLHEMQTIYSLEDLYDLLEMASVDGHNRRMVEKHYEQERERANRD